MTCFQSIEASQLCVCICMRAKERPLTKHVYCVIPDERLTSRRLCQQRVFGYRCVSVRFPPSSSPAKRFSKPNEHLEEGGREKKKRVRTYCTCCMFWNIFVCCAARLGCGSPSAGSGTERRVHRLLSFQRYLHSSRLLRGITQQIPLPILDEDYSGQARVWHTSCILEHFNTMYRRGVSFFLTFILLPFPLLVVHVGESWKLEFRHFPLW